MQPKKPEAAEASDKIDWEKMVSASEPIKIDPLEGKFFHTFVHFFMLDKQGKIKAKISTGFYLVQFYSFIDGEPTEQEIYSVENMKGWKIYNTEDHWLYAYEEYRQKRLAAEEEMGFPPKSGQQVKPPLN